MKHSKTCLNSTCILALKHYIFVVVKRKLSRMNLKTLLQDMLALIVIKQSPKFQPSTTTISRATEWQVAKEELP